MENIRRTKIVATVGPSCSTAEKIKELIYAGVNVFRLNFSHGNHEVHTNTIKNIRTVAKKEKKVVAILQDIQGPKIRIGDVENGEAELKEGAEFHLTNKELVANSKIASVSYEYLFRDIEVGALIMIDDGRLELKVERVEDDKLVCKVIIGGLIRPNKGVNFPGTKLDISCLTDKDIEDIKLGVKQRVDFIAVSFVQKASDIMEVKDFLTRHHSKIPIVSKIETKAAIQNIEEIISISDGIMVARGDLGVEMPTEDMPILQKKIISLCNHAAIPVITATQMLDSMVSSSRPTRAETTDVANAILDGSDAVMLSNETAVGKFPVKVVETMSKIAFKAEERLINTFGRIGPQNDNPTITYSLCRAATNIAYSLDAKAIITATQSGVSAKNIAKYRSSSLILAATPESATLRQMSLVWGVVPVEIPSVYNTDELMKTVLDAAKQTGILDDGDILVITAGAPLGVPGTTNLIKVEVVSTIIAKGTGLGISIAHGKAKIVYSSSEAIDNISEGDILITAMTDIDYMPAIEKCGAIITEEGGLTSHAAIVAMSMGKPLILGVPHIFDKVENEQMITIDPRRGLIFTGNPKIV